MSGFEQLLTALEGRYDFQSARIMARESLAVAGLKEQPKYSPEELQKLADGLAVVGSNLDGVWTALGIAPSGAPAPAPAPAAKPPAAKADEKKADEKKADEKKPDEKKADEKKPADKADEKKADDKGGKKGDDKGGKKK
ncbi:MAG: hypothetical protein ACI9MR_001509 [Myxococcota bacterium]|jgi:hypothetical protein